MNLFSKSLLLILSISCAFLNFSRTANAYSEMQLGADGILFLKKNPDTEQIKPFGGWSIRADIMNNVGFSFGISHTYSEGYRFFDARELYWTNAHMFGFYGGLSQHFQYFNSMEFGAGINLGYSLPLTYYINLNLESEAGYGSVKFYRSIYDPFYFILSAGISINIF